VLFYALIPMEPRNRPFFLLLALILSLLTRLPARAQTNPNYPVKANIVYYFTKYIDWPEDKASGEFVIGIMGSTPMYDEMVRNIGEKTIAGRRLTIKKFPPNSTGCNCQILFIGEGSSGKLRSIAAATAGQPILLVTESEGLERKGACINLVIVDEHLKMEINKTNINSRNLGIAPELLELGTVVK